MRCLPEPWYQAKAMAKAKGTKMEVSPASLLLEKDLTLA